MTKTMLPRIPAVLGLLLLGSAHTAGPASAQPTAEQSQSSLALEPIGGFTDLGNVRVLTTALCPAQSTSIIVRISGGGFAPDTNVMGNTEIANVLRTPDGKGYVAGIFADWEYLAGAHKAKTPLEGPASLTLLCADSDLERIDARMQGSLRFESTAGKKSTYLQDGGPRLATGIPGIPPPGNGGVPKDAPVAPTVQAAQAMQPAPAARTAPQAPTTPAPAGTGTGTTPGTTAGAATANSTGSVGGLSADLTGDSDQPGAELQATGSQTSSVDGSGGPATSVAVAAFAVLLIVAAIYLFVRRPRSDDPTTL